DILVWILVLLVQSIPYLAAVMMSIISASTQVSAKKLISTITAPPEASSPVGTGDRVKESSPNVSSR
ncbi:MAG: hypothetical protein KKF12_11570, partial [Proteobacteria bacterium]|nr:hypothetical protein [Pseudomonadota bacterium]